jgi:hypothetical protein
VLLSTGGGVAKDKKLFSEKVRSRHNYMIMNRLKRGDIFGE